MTPVESMERLAGRFVEAIERSDRAALDAIYTPDAVIWRNYDNREQSREDNIAALEKHPALFKSFKYVNIRRAFFASGYVQQHIASGVKAGGEPFNVPVCMVIAVRGDRIARVDEYFDSAQDARPAKYR